MEILGRLLRHRSTDARSSKSQPGRFGLSVLLLFFFFVPLLLPPELPAIHAIIKGKEALPRKHGPVGLGMDSESFLKSAGGRLEKAAIGQFEDEARYHLNPLLFSDAAESILADFYAGSLFRIEINYKRGEKRTPLQTLINEWSDRYGKPRENVLPGVRLLFWDDGATRMILEIDETEGLEAYSVTYIDDALFHKSSRDRVQRETAGASQYGK